MRLFLTLLVVVGILSITAFAIYTIKEVEALKIENKQLASKVKNLNREIKLLNLYVKAKTKIIYRHNKKKRRIYETPSNYVRFNSIFK